MTTTPTVAPPPKAPATPAAPKAAKAPKAAPPAAPGEWSVDPFAPKMPAEFSATVKVLRDHLDDTNTLRCAWRPVVSEENAELYLLDEKGQVLTAADTYVITNAEYFEKRVAMGLVEAVEAAAETD